jgi:predicted porin
MNKKVMALAVAGALAAPGAALAQASSVQIFGNAYVEYGYFKQAAKSPGSDYVNADIMQDPGAELGVKGEEALGGGYSVWFQCASSMELLGAGNAARTWCGRNSAIGLKGAFGNLYGGNWDMPMKKTGTIGRLVSDTGLWGVGPLLFGGSGSTIANGAAQQWSNRQNNSIFYDTPVWNGFQLLTGFSTIAPGNVAGTTNLSGNKPRMWGLAATYTNGPLVVMAGYENHDNYSPSGAATNGNDYGWQIGARYRFGPILVGVVYTKQNYDTGVISGVSTSADASGYGIGGEWTVQGPHVIRAGYHVAQDTGGNFNAGSGAAGALMGNRVYNAGIGATGATIWQIQYVFNASKRTEFTLGYASLSNDQNARYALGGAALPGAGQDQNAFGISWKHGF